MVLFIINLGFMAQSVEAKLDNEFYPYGFWVPKATVDIFFPEEARSKNINNENVLPMADPRKTISEDPSGLTSKPEVNKGSGNVLYTAAMVQTDPPYKDDGFNKHVTGDEKPETVQSESFKKNSMNTAPQMRYGMIRNIGPVESVYLMLKGVTEPDEVPEVYYRFTARTLERHGGVPLSSTYHKAKVEKDKNGLWRADLIGNTFGTFEIFSRYKVKGKTFYGQMNFLHFLREDAKDGPVAENVKSLPADWPTFIFPMSKYNEMPFRGTQTENKVYFEVLRDGNKIEGAKGFLVDIKEGPFTSAVLNYEKERGDYNLTPPDDPTLKVVSGPMGGSSETKNMVALLTLPNGENMTFTLTVSRAKWSYKKIGLGVILTLAAAIIIGIITADRRRKFKYNEHD
jgi:hypothetical protein